VYTTVVYNANMQSLRRTHFRWL